LSFPDTIEVRVHDSNADLRYVVLPLRPQGTDALSEMELASLVSRDCLVGMALPGQKAGS
jgi:nitrile hydratase